MAENKGDDTKAVSLPFVSLRLLFFLLHTELTASRIK